MVASLVITRTHVRFYLAARLVVNIFAPRQFWGARASRVLAMVSSPSRPFLTYSIKPAMRRPGSSFRRDAETSTRDACATYSARRAAGLGGGLGRGLGVV